MWIEVLTTSDEFAGGSSRSSIGGRTSFPREVGIRLIKF